MLTYWYVSLEGHTQCVLVTIFPKGISFWPIWQIVDKDKCLDISIKLQGTGDLNYPIKPWELFPENLSRKLFVYGPFLYWAWW